MDGYAHMEKKETSSNPTVFDESVALEHCAGDPDLLKDLVNMFIKECPGIQAAMKEAAEQKDSGSLKALGHTLAGMLSTLGAGPGAASARRLEQVAQKGDLEATLHAYREINKELEDLFAVLEKF